MIAAWAHHDGWFVLVPLFWLAVIAIAVVLFGRRRGRWLSAEEVLDRRFAEGDLTAEEYRERRAVLREERSGPA